MKKVTLFFTTFVLLIFYFLPAYSQLEIEIPLENDNDWFSFYEDENILLSVKYADCSDESNGIFHDYYLLKLQNKTDSTILVDWHYDLFYDGECTTCVDSDNEFLFRYELSPGIILEPDCDNYIFNPPYQLAIFNSIINKPDLPKLSKAVISKLTLYKY